MSCYILRDIPKDLHQLLREASRQSGRTIRHIILKGAESEAAKAKKAK